MNLTDQLSELNLKYLARNLEGFLSEVKNTESHHDVIAKMTELEIADKTSRMTERRLKTSKIGVFRPMEEFDWAWTKGLEKSVWDRLHSLDFIKSKNNIIITGPQGLGKSMIAKNLAYHAALNGHSVLFTTASKLVLDLDSQESSITLQRKLTMYQKLKLLVIDELGYLKFTDKAADFVFEIVNRRYENGSIIITTNLSFKEWHKVFPGAPCVTAMIDRLTHHADILKLTGDSYRRREASYEKEVKNG